MRDDDGGGGATPFPPPSSLHLPPTNVGFRLLLRGGWDPQKGLGPTGGGTRTPPKTELKWDQRGLGCPGGGGVLGSLISVPVTSEPCRDPPGGVGEVGGGIWGAWGGIKGGWSDPRQPYGRGRGG